MGAQDDILSETEAAHAESDNLKLVPVAESIRYRKRAQSAEKQIESLSQELAEARSQASEMSEQLRDTRIYGELTKKLAVAGVVDLETAVLIAKARAEAQEQPDLDAVIEELRREKQYLFGGGAAATPRRTAPVKDRVANNQAVLERAAKKAAGTGNRTDLQEYLKLRRNFL
ncbi:MAG: hypothetical protein ACYSR6_00755 [Planctomycetota bacterium]|jgi:hypothetical protein